MAADAPVLLLIALTSWRLIGLVVLVIGGIATSILARAIGRAQIGYEDDTGYHEGTPPESLTSKKSSRTAHSTKQNRVRETEEQKRKTFRQGSRPKTKKK